MKIVYKGIYKNEKKTRLPETVLPDDAVKFKEPKSVVGLLIFCIPIMLMVYFFYDIAIGLLAEIKGIEPNTDNIYSVSLFFLTIIPHELLHAACYPSDAKVSLYISPSKLMAFVWSDCAITKKRFIIMSLCPNIVLGVLPVLIWFFLPNGSSIGEISLGLSMYAIICGAGDYINVINAVIQMPKGSYTQLSGLNSYWFLKG